MTEPTAYVFPQVVTRIYEKEVVKAVHIRDKGGPNQIEEIEVQKVGWVVVVGDIGYLIPEKPNYDVGQLVDVIIRPVEVKA